MRKLLASLLFLPLLSGASGGTVVRLADAPSPVESVAVAGAWSASLPLPVHVSDEAFAAPTTLLQIGATDNWRTATRSGRSSHDMLSARAHGGEARTHLDRLQRSRLEFGHTLARARANEPTTFGNPPPASQT